MEAFGYVRPRNLLREEKSQALRLRANFLTGGVGLVKRRQVSRLPSCIG